MPKVDDVGYGELTPFKLELLSKIFDMHLAITQAVINKNNFYNRTYLYIDLTSGKGFSPDSKLKGSPLVFLDSFHQLTGLPISIELIECNSKNIMELEDNVKSYCQQNTWDFCNIHFHPHKYEDVIKDILPVENKKQLGLIFVDPSGDLPDFDVLGYIARVRPRMEILVYIPTTNVKRQRGKLLSEYMDEMGKRYWLVRRPISWDKFKWTFLLGSSHPTIFQDYKAIDFVRLDSPEAVAFFPKLNLTSEQRIAKNQPRLFE